MGGIVDTLTGAAARKQLAGQAALAREQQDAQAAILAGQKQRVDAVAAGQQRAAQGGGGLLAFVDGASNVLKKTLG